MPGGGSRSIQSAREPSRRKPPSCLRSGSLTTRKSHPRSGPQVTAPLVTVAWLNPSHLRKNRRPPHSRTSSSKSHGKLKIRGLASSNRTSRRRRTSSSKSHGKLKIRGLASSNRTSRRRGTSSPVQSRAPARSNGMRLRPLLLCRLRRLSLSPPRSASPLGTSPCSGTPCSAPSGRRARPPRSFCSPGRPICGSPGPWACTVWAGGSRCRGRMALTTMEWWTTTTSCRRRSGSTTTTGHTSGSARTRCWAARSGGSRRRVTTRSPTTRSHPRS